MPSPVVHFEIGSKDSVRLSQFYGELFGWTFLELGDVRPIIEGLEGGPSGMLNTLGHPPENYVLIYIQVDDVSAALDKVIAGRGKVLVGPADLPDGRTFAWFRDPAGNMIGLLSPLP